MKVLSFAGLVSATLLAACFMATPVQAAPTQPAFGGSSSCPYNYHEVDWSAGDGMMTGCAPGGGVAVFLSGDTPPAGTIYIHRVTLHLP